MREKEINEFLSFLVVKKKVTPSTQNQTSCAIVFLYNQVLNEEIGFLEGLIRATWPARLPVVIHLQLICWKMIMILEQYKNF